MVLVNRGAAVCIEEKDLTADRLWEAICSATDDPAKLAEMGEKSREAAILDAGERIMTALKELLGK